MKVAIGQDSHRFDLNNKEKPFILGGIVFENEPPVLANSDGDAVLHAIANAISGITSVNIMGKRADEMCQQGVIEGEEYVKEALKYLKEEVVHISVSIECKTPKITPKIEEMRANIARILKIEKEHVGITATTGEGLTDFGKGLGIQVFSVITTA